MGDAFEWFDPYEQKARAEREEANARTAYWRGKDEVEKVLGRAVHNKLAEKLDMVVQALAHKIVARMAMEIGGKMAQSYVASQMGPRAAKLFRLAMQDCLKGIALPERAEVRTKVDHAILGDEEAMTVSFETTGPIRVHHRFFL